MQITNAHNVYDDRHVYDDQYDYDDQCDDRHFYGYRSSGLWLSILWDSTVSLFFSIIGEQK